MNETAFDYDILIIGGGMVGASLGCALGGQPLRVGIVEAVAPGADFQPSYDARAIALAWGSRRIFESLGAWQAMRGGATPIEHIHVSDRGQFGVTRLDAADEGLPALGYVVEAEHIGQALGQCLQQFDNVELLNPASLIDLHMAADHARAEIEIDGDRRELSSRLIVAADGGNSRVRELLGIAAKRKAYGQSAIISTVTPGRGHGNTAYERFTDSGPIALLPLSGQRCSLVFTVPDSEREATLALDDDAFLRLLEQRFGHRLGGFSRMGRRFSYPLTLQLVNEHIRPRVVVIGNAAHALHPIAGQGFNLGLRDVAALAEVIVDAYTAGEDPGALKVLQQYEDWRLDDQRRVAGATDTLARVFSNRFWPLRHARGAGLVITDLLPPLKHGLARYAMGLAGRQPKLARGVNL